MPSGRAALITLTAALGVGLVLGGGSAVLEKKAAQVADTGKDSGSTVGSPADGGTETSGAKPPTRKVTLDLRGSAERPTKVPYWSHRDKAILAGGRKLGVERAPLSVAPMANGKYAVLTATDESFGLPDPGRDPALSLVDADWDFDLGSADPAGVAVSRDGERLAWTTGKAATLMFADAPGDASTVRLDKKKLSGAENASVVGFVGERVLLNLTEQKVGVYDPGSGAVEEVDGVTQAYAASRDGKLVVFGTPKRCAEVRTGTEPGAKRVWSSCEHLPFSFSPDGRYIATVPIETDDAGERSTRIVDLETGKAVLELRADRIGQLVWEDQESVVVAAYSRGRFGLVTCTLDGKCVRATEAPKHGPTSDLPVPYLLATT